MVAPVTLLSEPSTTEARVATSPAVAAAFAEQVDRATTPATVGATRTRLSGADAAAALERAWTRVMGSPPSRETLSLITAQWAHETGGGASMYNFNFGGLKGTSPEGMSVVQRTREGYGASERTIHDRFRAYSSAEAGATDYVRLLHARYGDAVQAAQAGDARGFVRGLASRGYFTGSPEAYERSVAALSRAALSQGFDAVGQGRTEVTALPRAAGSAPGIDGIDAGLPLETTSYVDTLALADEVSRSALRVAAEATRSRREGER